MDGGGGLLVGDEGEVGAEGAPAEPVLAKVAMPAKSKTGGRRRGAPRTAAQRAAAAQYKAIWEGRIWGHATADQASLLGRTSVDPEAEELGEGWGSLDKGRALLGRGVKMAGEDDQW